MTIFFTTFEVVICDCYTIKVILMMVLYKSDVALITIYYLNKLLNLLHLPHCRSYVTS